MALIHGLSVSDSDKRPAILVDNAGGLFLNTGIPRVAVTPEVSSSPQAVQLWDAGSGQLVYDWRYTVNAGDDVVAGSRLLNEQPDTGILLPDSKETIVADVAITRLDVVASGDVTNATAGGTILLGTSTEANTRAAMVTFEWDSADDVRMIILTGGALFGSSRYGRTFVEGRSYA